MFSRATQNDASKHLLAGELYVHSLLNADASGLGKTHPGLGIRVWG